MLGLKVNHVSKRGPRSSHVAMAAAHLGTLWYDSTHVACSNIPPWLVKSGLGETNEWLINDLVMKQTTYQQNSILESTRQDLYIAEYG